MDLFSPPRPMFPSVVVAMMMMMMVMTTIIILIIMMDIHERWLPSTKEGMDLNRVSSSLRMVEHAMRMLPPRLLEPGIHLGSETTILPLRRWIWKRWIV